MSRGDLLVMIGVLAVFGVADAAYLAWQWYEAANATWCDIGSYFSCSRVRESPFAAVGGIPTAFLGVGGFAILIGLAFLAIRGRKVLGPWSVDRWIRGFAVLGAVFGTALSLLEVFVIEAVCILCVIGFALDLAILGPAFLLMQPGR